MKNIEKILYKLPLNKNIIPKIIKKYKWKENELLIYIEKYLNTLKEIQKENEIEYILFSE